MNHVDVVDALCQRQNTSIKYGFGHVLPANDIAFGILKYLRRQIYDMNIIFD